MQPIIPSSSAADHCRVSRVRRSSSAIGRLSAIATKPPISSHTIAGPIRWSSAQINTRCRALPSPRPHPATRSGRDAADHARVLGVERPPGGRPGQFGARQRGAQHGAEHDRHERAPDPRDRNAEPDADDIDGDADPHRHAFDVPAAHERGDDGDGGAARTSAIHAEGLGSMATRSPSGSRPTTHPKAGMPCSVSRRAIVWITLRTSGLGVTSAHLARYSPASRSATAIRCEQSQIARPSNHGPATYSCRRPSDGSERTTPPPTI